MKKRLFDILSSLLALVMLLPLFAVIALLVKASSPGPVFFRQERVGLNGRLFEIIKFRTMRSGGAGSLVTVSGDTRVTRIGRLLRSSKLDEIPQFWNVLVGEMSIVGPRPEVSVYVEKYPTIERAKILSVRPGLADPITLILRNEEDVLSGFDDPMEAYERIILPRKVAAYVEYVETQSFFCDLAILVRTMLAIAVRRRTGVSYFEQKGSDRKSVGSSER